ncbi:unnamed protein product, partial [Phaeothamnion confervicola]
MPFLGENDDIGALELSRGMRITVHSNGRISGGKTLHVQPHWSMDDLLNAAQQRLALAYAPRRVFNADGMEITDLMMLEDDAIAFVSGGSDFVPPELDDADGAEGGGGGATTGSPNGGGGGSGGTSSGGWSGSPSSGLPAVVGGYRVKDFLGRGGFGEVRVGEHQLTGERVALKFLRKSDIASMGAAERTTTEMQCLTALKHPAVIRLVQHVDAPGHVVLAFELMEGGDLFHHLCGLPGQCLPEEDARAVFHQILSGMAYAHNQHICHRDMKLDNVLLAKANSLEGGVKIADFGLSDFYRPGATMRTNCGSLSYLAPEVFRGTANAGPPLDIWSLGVILFAMLCGRLPFEGSDLAGSNRPR